MAEKRINVLYVDDEVNNLVPFKAAFRKEFNVFTALSALEAEAILDNGNDIHVLITDQRMPVKKGTELLEEAVKKYPNQTRIILTAYPEDKAVQEAEKMQLIYRAAGKPFDENELRNYIKEGYDLFYSKINQQQRIINLNRVNEELNKPLKKNKKK